ncbi:MAG: hypothetical protein QXS91_02995 [Candidatus Anstonellales archaeon]
MMLKKFFALLGFLIAISLLAYGFFGLGFDFLLRAIAISVGFSIIFLIFYPRIRGVRKGDEVVVVAYSFMPSFLGRRGRVIRIHKNNVVVRLDEDGREVTGILETYEELLSPPRVRLIYEEQALK